jgi:hypothetical protein
MIVGVKFSREDFVYAVWRICFTYFNGYKVS